MPYAFSPARDDGKIKIVDPVTGRPMPAATNPNGPMVGSQIAPQAAPMVGKLHRYQLHRNDLRYRAKGGPVKRGKAYVVGERGKELFVPKQDGKIIPHSKLMGMGAKMKKNRRKKTAKC